MEESKHGCSHGRVRTWQNLAMISAVDAAKLLQLCQTLCDSIDGSPPGSSVPGIRQARLMEWVAIAFSVDMIFDQITIGQPRQTWHVFSSVQSLSHV